MKVSAAMDTQATIDGLWGTMFEFGPCEVVIKKISVENRQSPSGVSSEQLVESWALQSGCEENTLCVME
jgi:hypothetical protein